MKFGVLTSLFERVMSRHLDALRPYVAMPQIGDAQRMRELWRTIEDRLNIVLVEDEIGNEVQR